MGDVSNVLAMVMRGQFEHAAYLVRLLSAQSWLNVFNGHRRANKWQSN